MGHLMGWAGQADDDEHDEHDEHDERDAKGKDYTSKKVKIVGV